MGSWAPGLQRGLLADQNLGRCPHPPTGWSTYWGASLTPAEFLAIDYVRGDC